MERGEIIVLKLMTKRILGEGKYIAFREWYKKNRYKYFIEPKLIKDSLAAGDLVEIPTNVRCNLVKYGNDYGGYYVCPDYLSENPIVYSCGIGKDLSFDEQIIKIKNCSVYAFDPTPMSIDFVKNSEIYKSDEFHFYEYGISDKDEQATFYLNEEDEINDGSASVLKKTYTQDENKIIVEMKCIQTICNILHHNYIDVLKLDIEGSEFAVMDHIVENQLNIGQICLELHGRFLKKEERKEKYERLLNQIQKGGYKVAFTTYSPQSQEITIIKKELLK